MGLLDTSPRGFQSWAFGGLSVRCRFYKVGYQIWGSNPSLLGEKLWVVSSFQIGGHCAGGRVHGEIVVSASSAPFVWDSLICLVCRSCSVTFGLSSEEIVPFVAVDSVCPGEEVRSEASSVAILNWNLSVWNFWVLFCPVSASGYLLLEQFLLIYCWLCRFPVWLLFFPLRVFFSWT